MSTTTMVHLLRHGEVHNPDGILYGRLPGYRLSARGRTMAERVAERIGDRDITHVIASPLERAQETAGPLAAARGLPIETDPRIIESGNVFEGKAFSVRDGVLLKPGMWPKLWNPFRPSWGEPYRVVADRMWSAVLDARVAAEGHEAVLVSHQLPVWICRLHAERKRYWHDPRQRQCTLCSLTSLTFEDDRLTTVSYSEPAGDLIPLRDRKSNFSKGGSTAEAEDPA